MATTRGMSKKIHLLHDVNISLNALITQNNTLGYLRRCIDVEAQKWQSITHEIRLANAIRRGLFELRNQLREIKPDSAELTALKKIIHEKLLYLAENFPLNKKNGRGSMFCPMSGNSVGIFKYYKQYPVGDLVLSNGYIYDGDNIRNALIEDETKPFPAIPNLSEFDVTRIHNLNRSRKLDSAFLAGLSVFFISLVVGLVVTVLTVPVTLPSILVLGLVVGMMAGSLLTSGISAAIAYNVTNEQRPANLPTYYSATTIHDGLGSKPLLAVISPAARVATAPTASPVEQAIQPRSEINDCLRKPPCARL